MVEDMLATLGIIVSHETVRRWAMKFGRDFANKFAVPLLNSATNGISARLSSRSTARSIGFGARSIRMALSLTL